jgi:hypothetical protein
MRCWLSSAYFTAPVPITWAIWVFQDRKAFALGHDSGGAFDGFVEHFEQAHALAGAGFEHLAVLAQDAAKGDVLHARGLAAFLRDLKELAEVQLLRRADDIPDFIRLPVVDAVVDGGEVGGGIEEAAVALADEAGLVGEFRHVAKEDAGGAVADLGDAGGEQVLDERRELVVVGAFAEIVIEVDVELAVNLAQLLQRKGHAARPDFHVVRIALLELHEFVAAGGQHGLVGLRLRVHRLVNADEFLDGIFVERCMIEDRLPAVQDHAELRAPVADVVVGDDLVADEAGDARERVADEGAADVADVHRLGDVRRGEVDDDASSAARPAARRSGHPGRSPRGAAPVQRR